MSPEEIVEAIWAYWAEHLGDWDLEGSTANLRARRLAYEVLAEALTPDADPDADPDYWPADAGKDER